MNSCLAKISCQAAKRTGKGGTAAPKTRAASKALVARGVADELQAESLFLRVDHEDGNTAIGPDSADFEVNQVIRALQAQKGARRIYQSICEFFCSLMASTLTL